MKEVKKCSISGIAFTLDIDAFEELEKYLSSLKRTYKGTPDGAEIVADIEARIAELILTAQDSDRVVEKPLILHIIEQLGTAEDISEDSLSGENSDEPRIPRRLYRDTENAKLGGVCAGIGKYFDVDPVWIRLGIFLPVVLTMLHWFPHMYWIGSMMGNLFGIFVICYLIMWFAVPAARTARQKLEMNGQRITTQSIRETTVASSEAAGDADAKAKPIVAEAVSVFGRVVLFLLKLFAGLLVFALILIASGLIIGLFAIVVGGGGILATLAPLNITIWIPILVLFIVLLPIILLIYVLMCLIASRKPGMWAVITVFLLWLVSLIVCMSISIHENVFHKLGELRKSDWQLFDSKVRIDTNDDGVRVNAGDLRVRIDDDGISVETVKETPSSTPAETKTVDKQSSTVDASHQLPQQAASTTDAESTDKSEN